MKLSVSPEVESKKNHGVWEPIPHKVLTYVDCRVLSVSGVFQNIDPPPSLYPASVSSPRTKGGGYTLAGQCGGGGSLFWKTPDIGLASYSIISQRYTVTGVDYNLFLGPLQGRLQHISHAWATLARIDLNHMPESTLSPSSVFGFGLGWHERVKKADAVLFCIQDEPPG